MPYLLLAIGLLIGLYALYRFFLNANTKQIGALFITAVVVTICLALFYLAITGRLPAALGLLVALIPFVIGYFKNRLDKKDQERMQAGGKEPPTTREEALEILGLKEGADEKAVKAAYKKLMQKVHPDHEGSEWMAAKLNQARDILLNNKE